MTAEELQAYEASWDPAYGDHRVALVDLLDRVLVGGVVISGEVRISLADVDMVHVSLRALITSVGSLADASIRDEPEW
jgi:hypothetical protein